MACRTTTIVNSTLMPRKTSTFPMYVRMFLVPNSILMVIFLVLVSMCKDCGVPPVAVSVHVDGSLCAACQTRAAC